MNLYYLVIIGLLFSSCDRRHYTNLIIGQPSVIVTTVTVQVPIEDPDNDEPKHPNKHHDED